MNPKPTTITVYITSYNQQAYLTQAIESVLNQIRVPDQIVIIDDASTDDSQSVIRSFHRAHKALVHPIFNESNQGVAESRKRAVHAAAGDLVTCLDGDDLYLSNKLHLQEQALRENPEAGYAYSNFAFIDEAGNQTGTWSQSPLPSGNIFDLIATRSLPRNACHRSELIRRDALLKAEDYEHGRNLYEDFDTLLRLSRFNNTTAIDEVTHLYRINSAGLSNASYPKHYEALHYWYSKNDQLLQGLDRAVTKKINSGINKILSENAWNSVRQMAKSQLKNSPAHSPLYYAKAGIMHQPTTILNPKRTSQLIRALIRS